MARPIPKHFLIHSIVYRERTGIDRNREPTYTDYIIQHVRIDALLQTVKGAQAETKSDSLTLFIDRVYSRFTQKDGSDGFNPLTDENLEAYVDENGVTYGELLEKDVDLIFPKELDVIVWHKNAYTVRGVTPCYTKGTDELHHLEVQLE